MDNERHPEEAFVAAPAVTAAKHETSDVSIRPLAIFLALMTVTLLAVGGIVAGLFRWFEAQAGSHDPPAPAHADDRAPPVITEPLLQVSSRRDLQELRSREERVLGATEWVDRETGVARIPIERAIDLAAESGLPKWPAVEEPKADGEGGPQP